MFSSDKAALKPEKSTGLPFPPPHLLNLWVCVCVARVSKISKSPYTIVLPWFSPFISRLSSEGEEILKQHFLSWLLHAPKICLPLPGPWCLWTPHLKGWLAIGVDKGMQIGDKVAIFLELDSKKYYTSVNVTRFDDHSLPLQVNDLQVLKLI